MKRFDQINVIPFIDIMLVLLAIVLTTASFIATGKLDIDLPEAQAPAMPSPEQVVELAINRDNQIFIDQQLVMLEALQPQLENLAKDTTIELKIDEAVPFGRFVVVMDILKRNQLENLSIITRQKP